ncbi:MAG TPA: low-specificity L-threonine aldolase [Dehalococcoidia bacterium]|nr:low-specificity L-threonine aldolase [Dehalococcoidia bacterium]
MKPIDLRSDTVTHPTPAMREAMYRADVGDDVYGEDPTVNRLEALAAERLGKEAAVFVTSGTMGNLVALLAHAGRGDEVIVGDKSHTLVNEVAGAACLGSIQLRSVHNDDRGRLDPGEVDATIRGENIHFPRTVLIALENTHNRCNGAALSLEDMHPIVSLAHGRGIPIHIDGARIFNAAVALGVTPADLVREADSVQFCLSKGLSAPIGSMIVGSGEFISRARKFRKMVGGGMRQAGIMAAAGIVALEEMVDRMADDHVNAKALAQGLATIEGVEVDPDVVETNILFYRVPSMEQPAFVAALKNRGVLVGPGRMVTHYGITRADIDNVLEDIRAVLRAREGVAAG